MPIHAIAKSVYVCDEVVADPISGKPSILNIWDTVRVPANHEFPYLLDRLRVFVWWRGGVGRLKTRVDIVRAATGMPIATTAALSEGVIEFSHKRGSVYGIYRFDDLHLEPGYYYVEVYCGGTFIDDLAIRVLHDLEE